MIEEGTPIKRRRASPWWQRLRPWQLDAAVVVLLLLLNPLVYGVRLALNLSPDAITYLTFADSFIAHGALYLPSWGHVDTAVIVPPLYPFFIVTFNALRADPIGNALAISLLSMLLVTVLVFFYARRFAPRFIAAAVVLLIAVNLYYVQFASSIATEPLFLLIVLATLRGAGRLAPGGSVWQLVGIGLLAGAAFWVRHIGLVLGVVLVGWWLVVALCERKGPWWQRVREPLIVLAVWAACCGAYAAALYVQTGQTLQQQSFRAQNYVVRSADPAVWQKIEQLERAGEASYVKLYASRRQLRELLPDGSEMLAYVLPVNADKAPSTLAAETENESTARGPRLLRNLADSVGHFTQHVGWFTLVLLLLSFASPYFVRPAGVPWWPRLLLPGFLVVYIVGLSVLTGAIARYVIVLFPLAYLQIGVELGVLFGWLRKRRIDARVLAGAVALLFVALLWLTPRTLFNTILPPSAARADVPRTAIAGEPAFALLPNHAYLAGGTFRVLPNDRLEKVVHYAHLTGVRWILVPAQPQRILDSQFYTNAGWLQDPEALMRRKDLVRFCCRVEMTTAVEEQLLFEILPELPVR